jgi:hypothetical protein
MASMERTDLFIFADRDDQPANKAPRRAKRRRVRQPARWRRPQVERLEARWLLTEVPLGFSKAFLPDTIGPGSVSTLQFTITDNFGSPTTDMAFTDTLPAGVTIATPSNASTDCLEAVLTAPDGGSTITFSDGKLGASLSCTVSVNVTSSAAGTHMNTSSVLTSNHPNSSPATDDLTVAADRPGFTKSFAPSSNNLGSRTELTFTIDNTANSSAASTLDFTDNLPVGLVIANPASASTTGLLDSAAVDTTRRWSSPILRVLPRPVAASKFPPR